MGFKRWNLVSKTVQQHKANRDAFLEAIQDILRKDEGVVAVWLTGSLGRRESDAFSDIDISVALNSQDSSLVNHARSFVTKVDRAVNIHEASQNAPLGGTMFSVLYENGITVDWAIIPAVGALRPNDSLLLVERNKIEAGETLKFGQPIPEKVDHRISFFWNMAAVTAKTILRDNTENSEEFLKVLDITANEIAAFLKTPSQDLDRDDHFGLTTTEHGRELIRLCNQVCAQTGESIMAFDTILALLKLQT